MGWQYCTIASNVLPWKLSSVYVCDGAAVDLIALHTTLTSITRVGSICNYMYILFEALQYYSKRFYTAYLHISHIVKNTFMWWKCSWKNCSSMYPIIYRIHIYMHVHVLTLYMQYKYATQICENPTFFSLWVMQILLPSKIGNVNGSITKCYSSSLTVQFYMLIPVHV